jgi:hypothetical protein
MDDCRYIARAKPEVAPLIDRPVRELDITFELKKGR